MSDAEVKAKSLAALIDAEERCTRCPLYHDATQVVPGEGPRRARMMVVGEQPGDQEDIAGRPFVGPAGRIFDTALADAGIPRREIFVTNAVKHFKFERRGKKRLHSRPNAGEIERCKWWLHQERRLVAPTVLLATGATAIRSLLGRTVTIKSLRGEVRRLEDGTSLVATIHPSWLLRIRDADDRQRERERFVDDLRRGWDLANA